MEILGRGPPFEIEDFEILGAVLDAAGLKTGEQYLQEAKGMRVEDGWTWDLRLENHLTSCKRALKRNRLKQRPGTKSVGGKDPRPKDTRN